jgi:hypothetical protein
MENKLLFPIEYKQHKYKLIHFDFFIQYAKHAGINVELVDSNDTVFISDDKLIFSCTFNGKQFIVDYADHSYKNWISDFDNIPYFKFQTTISNRIGIPLGPPMVGVKKQGSKGATLTEYFTCRNSFNYVPGYKILSKQLPNGAATDRRNYVHQILLDKFNNSVDIDANDDQIDFWKLHETCLVSVCVPGATNNMVDRGHIEQIGLGVCTISPYLTTLFPGNTELTPGTHYIQCKDDYSDLIQIIEELQRDKGLSKYIGDNAKRFYNTFYTPSIYWKWIVENL